MIGGGPSSKQRSSSWFSRSPRQLISSNVQAKQNMPKQKKLDLRMCGPSPASGPDGSFSTFVLCVSLLVQGSASDTFRL